MTSTMPATRVDRKAATAAGVPQITEAPFLDTPPAATNFDPLFFGQLVAVARAVVALGLFTISMFYLSSFAGLAAQEVFGLNMDFDDA